MGGNKKITFKPRDYQLYYLQKAKEQNVIICLGTGSGKTFIACMLIREYGREIRRLGKKAVFLSPTVVLCQQQSEEMIKHTNFAVKAFYGDLGVDAWTSGDWAEEIDSVDILVLTPDLFERVLTKQYIEAGRICVCVFDECHHGGLKIKPGSTVLVDSNSAYKKICSFLTVKKLTNRIRIVGLTASVINACHNFIDLPRCVRSLESTYNARVLGEFDFDPRHLAEPTISTWLFNELVQLNPEFEKLLKLSKNLDEKLKKQKNKEGSKRYKVAWNLYYLVEKPLVKPSYVVRMLRDLAQVQTELGVYAAYIVCQEFCQELEKIATLIEKDHMMYLVRAAIKLLQYFEQFYWRTIQRFREQFGNELAMQRLATSKLLRLLDIIFCFNDRPGQSTFSALIFVDRVLYAFAIDKFLRHLSETPTFAYLKSSFFVGINSEYSQFKFIKEAHRRAPTTIKEFKEGAVNVLVCTSVLEEGIDIGACNLVIRFSEPKTYREFVQSKGRARAKDSFFCIMSDQQKDIENRLNNFEHIEKFLNAKFKQSKNEDYPIAVPSDHPMQTNEENFFESRNGARIYLHEARRYLEVFIAKKGNRNYHVDYSIEEIEPGFVFKLMLQGVCPLKNEVVSEVCSSRDLAFQSACMKAIKQLYADGHLDERFKPISDETVVSRCNLINREYDEGENFESRFVFNDRIKKRLMFEKQLSDRTYFEQFEKSTGGHDLYEISFNSDDEFLKQTDQSRLALLTKLELIRECLSTTVYGSVYDAEVRLALVRQNVPLNREELNKIGEFTFSVFKTAVPIFKKRKVKFDLDNCLFKFAFIKPDKSIDFGRMDKIVNLKESDLADGSDNLVRAIHTNTDYRLVSYNTNVRPSDTFYFEPEKKQISYSEYFQNKYDIELRDQEETLLQVEPAGLNACYSVFCKKEESEVNENKKAKFRIFLPKELSVISTVTKSLYKKLTTILPLTYKIKQQIILKHIIKSLDREILNIDDDCKQPGFGDSIFSSGSTSNFEPFKKRQRILAAAAAESCSEAESGSEESDDSLDAEIDKSDLDCLTEERVRQEKTRLTFGSDKHVQHESVNQQFLDSILFESINTELRTTSHPSLDDALEAFAKIFTDVISQPSNGRDVMRKFENTKFENRSLVMRASDELMRLDFNRWTTGSASVVDRERLKAALTTKSAAEESNLEVEEFLGDTFLKFITCLLLFHLHSEAPVGELDILKIRAISNRNLFVLSRRKRMHRFIFANKFLPGISYLPDGCSYTDGNKNQCTSDQPVTLMDSNGVSRSKMNLVNLAQYQELGAKSVADSIEALIGAVLVSSGYRTACLFMKFIGIYSNDFKIDPNSSQANWFSTKDGQNYNPVAVDPLKRKAQFTEEMYQKYGFNSLELKIGYTFKNKSLLIQAFKHHSYLAINEFPSYENLEFAGDAVIDFLIAKYFYDSGDFTPGELTDLKQSLINNNFFGALSIKYGLNDYLIYSGVTLFNLIGEYKMHYTNKYLPRGDDAVIVPGNYMILNEPETIDFEDVEAPKILADIFESLMAAIFLDSNFDLNVVWSVLHKFLANELIKFRQSPPKTYIAHVFELFPDARFGNTRKSGQLTLVDLAIEEKTYTGEGVNKRQARMDASRHVLRNYLNLENS